MTETTDDKMARWSTRYFDGFPENPEDSDYTDYCLYRLSVYKQNEWYGEELANIFADDFERFDNNAFLHAHRDARQNLRSILRQRGIFVRTARSVRIADALVELISNGFSTWPTTEPPERPAISLMTPTDAATYKERLRHEMSQSSYTLPPATPGPHTAGATSVPAQRSQLMPQSEEESMTRMNFTQEQVRQVHGHGDDQVKDRSSPQVSAKADAPPQHGNGNDINATYVKQGQPSSLFKAYESNQDKYHGKPLENFERKLITFRDKCSICRLDEDNMSRAFHLMLGGLALTFYQDNLRGKTLTLNEFANAIRDRFYTAERTRAIVRAWETISFARIRRQHPQKSIHAQLDVMITLIGDIYSLLPDEYHHESIHRDRILNAVRDDPACKLAYQKPASTVAGVISDLEAAASAADAQGQHEEAIAMTTMTDFGYHPPDPSNHELQQFMTEFSTLPQVEEQHSDAYLVDRQYKSNYHHPRRSLSQSYSHRSQRPYNSNHRRPPVSQYQQPPYQQMGTQWRNPARAVTQQNVQQQRRCFVCNRVGCWSTRHSPQERTEAFRRHPFSRNFLATLTGVDNHPSDAQSEAQSQPYDETAEDAVRAHVIDATRFLWQDTTPQPSTSTATDIPEDHIHCNYISVLQTSSFKHSCSVIQDQSVYIGAPPHDAVQHHERYATHFHGIMVDTGCSRASTGGVEQYRAYCKLMGRSPVIDPKRKCAIHFGNGSTTSIGIAVVDFPLGPTWVSIDVHVLTTRVPILLSLADMDRLQIFYNNLNDKVIQPETNATQPIIRKFGHPFICWDHNSASFFTETELRRLHRRFGHPSSRKLISLLERADFLEVDEQMRKTLEAITAQCRLCQMNQQRPRRFRFTIRDDKEFNSTVYVDIFYIDGHAVLHVVDEATRFQAAQLLSTVTSENVWTALRRCWMDVYVGPPDMVIHDAGKQFVAHAFQRNAHMFHIRTKAVPVEAAHSMSLVERYHEPVRRTVRIVRTECPEIDFASALQIAIKAINDTAGPDGLVPTLLVFGTLPRLGFHHDAPAASVTKRARAQQAAMAEMRKIHAQRQIRTALHSRNGPDPPADKDFPIGSKAIVWRDSKKRWDGPYTILAKTGEDITLLCDPPAGPTTFRSTAVRPYIADETAEKQDNDDDKITGPTPSNSTTAKSKLDELDRILGDIREHVDNAISIEELMSYLSHVVKTTEADHSPHFRIARSAEFQGLLEQGVFSLAWAEEAEGHRCYNSRFVDEIRDFGLPTARHKSRLVVQAFLEKLEEFLTYAPTILRASQRLFVCLAAIFRELIVFLRDIIQAYTQSDTTMTDPVFVKPPKCLGFPPDVILRVERCLYGLPESGLHWFGTYHKHHMAYLHLRPSVHDPCFLYTPRMFAKPIEQKNAIGLTCLQTDDTANLGTRAFQQREQEGVKKFRHKPATQLDIGKKALFNGALLTNHSDKYTMTQPVHISKLQKLPLGATAKDYVTQRARGAYIASVCRPDLAFGFAYCAQTTNPMNEDIQYLNSLIEKAKATPDKGLTFVSLDRTSLRIIVFADASFATNRDLSSQLGFVTTLADKQNKANIIHYHSVKARRVTRSVLAAELFACVNSFDHSSTLRVTLNDMFGRPVPLVVCTDSKSLYDMLVGLKSTTEKRLLIDLAGLREAYEMREIDEIIWIPSECNPADALTKKDPCVAMDKLQEHNEIDLNPNAWVERKEDKWKGGVPANLHTVSDDLREILVSVQECTDIHSMTDISNI